MTAETSRRRTRLAVALALSLLAHALLAWWLSHQLGARQEAAAGPGATTIELTLSAPERPTPAFPLAPARAPLAERKPAKARPAEPPPVGRPDSPAREAKRAAPAAVAEAPAPGGELRAGPAEPSAGEAAGTLEGKVTDVPRALDLGLHGEVTTASPGGETVRAGDPQLRDAGPNLAPGRIAHWADDTSATQRVEQGVVDEWFIRVRKSIDRALAASPPPVVKLGDKRRVPSGSDESDDSPAEAFGRTGTPGTPSGPGIPPPFTEAPGLANMGPMGTFKLSVDDGETMWVVIELRYDGSGNSAGSRLLRSSGDREFEHHVLTTVSRRLPGFPELPDAGFGLHPEGTRSVWEIRGHVTYKQDAREANLVNPLDLVGAAVSGVGFDEVSGKVAVNDFSHPHVVCKVKLLQVY